MWAGRCLTQSHLGTSLPSQRWRARGRRVLEAEGESEGAGGAGRGARARPAAQAPAPQQYHMTPSLPLLPPLLFLESPTHTLSCLKVACPNSAPPGPEKPAFLTDASPPPQNQGSQGLCQGPAGSSLKVSPGPGGGLPSSQQSAAMTLDTFSLLGPVGREKSHSVYQHILGMFK